MTSGPDSEIPVVDLGRSGAVRALDRAWRDIGFVSLVGHGIDPTRFDEMRAMLRRIFALDDATKRRHRITVDDYRGFIPLGFFTPNRAEVSGTTADAYEGFKLHWECPEGHPARDECRLYGANRWVPEIDDMAEVVGAYWSACDDLATVLLEAVAVVLGVDTTALRSMFDAPLTNMTLLHYPPVPAGAAGGFHPHKDTNVLTFVHPDPVGGLEVRSPDGGWIPAEGPPEALIVNPGEMLELWSGGHYLATPHRVRSQHAAHRYSFPYFLVPSHDVVVEPLVESRPGFRRPPMPVGELSAEVWRTNWPGERPRDDDHDLGSLDR